MHDRDILPLNVIHHDLTNLRLHASIPQEQQIPPLKRGLHAPRKHDDDGRGRVGGDGEAFPEHKGGGENEGEVEDLGEELAGLEGGYCGEHCRCIGGEGKGVRWLWNLVLWGDNPGVVVWGGKFRAGASYSKRHLSYKDGAEG